MMRTALDVRLTQAVMLPVAEEGIAARATPLPRTAVVMTPPTKPAAVRWWARNERGVTGPPVW
jgi:hypothetical protein